MTTSLVTAHGPVSDLFERPTAESVARYSLAGEQVAAFERDGFVIGLDILDEAQLAAVRAAVDRVVSHLAELEPQLYEVEAAHAERPGEVVCHFLGGWMLEAALHDVVFTPQVTVPLAQLLGTRRLRFWHDQVFHKPPHHPGSVPWHQDYSYWQRTVPARHITLNVVLDDADLDNGCLHFVPGSHRWRLLPSLPFDSDDEAIAAHLDDAEHAAFAERVPARQRAGQASIHHSHTLHGSAGNESDRPRRALVLNYMADGVCSATDEPLLRGVPVIPAGEVVRGDHFPIALDLDAV